MNYTFVILFATLLFVQNRISVTARRLRRAVAIRFKPKYINSLRGIPSNVCLYCGGMMFETLVQFDEEYTISWYSLEGKCLNCERLVTLPCPLDL